MNHTVWQRSISIERQHRVGEVDDQEIVILFHIRTEKQRARAADLEFPLGKESCALMKYPLVLEPKRPNVTVPIKNGERVGMLQHTGTRVRHRSIGLNIVLTLDLNDVTH